MGNSEKNYVCKSLLFQKFYNTQLIENYYYYYYFIYDYLFILTWSNPYLLSCNWK